MTFPWSAFWSPTRLTIICIMNFNRKKRSTLGLETNFYAERMKRLINRCGVVVGNHHVGKLGYSAFVCCALIMDFVWPRGKRVGVRLRQQSGAWKMREKRVSHETSLTCSGATWPRGCSTLSVPQQIKSISIWWRNHQAQVAILHNQTWKAYKSIFTDNPSQWRLDGKITNGKKQKKCNWLNMILSSLSMWGVRAERLDCDKGKKRRLENVWVIWWSALLLCIERALGWSFWGNARS